MMPEQTFLYRLLRMSRKIWTRIFIKPLFLEMYDLQKHQVTECQSICTIPDLPVLKHIDTLQKK